MMICSYCGEKLKKITAHRGGPTSALGDETATGYLCTRVRWYELGHHEIVVPGSMSALAEMTGIALAWLAIILPFAGLFFLLKGKI